MAEEITRHGMRTALAKGLAQYLNDMAKRRGLEPLDWSPKVVDYGQLREVWGQAGRAEFDDPAAVVTAWADAFGVEPTVSPHESFPSLDAVFEVDKVRVLVWCPVGEWG